MPLMYSGDGSQPRQDTRLAPVTHAEEAKMWRAAKTTATAPLVTAFPQELAQCTACGSAAEIRTTFSCG